MTVAALTIAGSDPSGGAGIQADLRVFAALGVAGLSAITALTVQNSLGVHAVHPVAPEVLAAQIEAVLSDSDVGAVKIGMLGGEGQVRAVAAALRRLQPRNVVLDPVLASTGGVPLLDDAGRRALLNELLPLCDLVTPNLPEAEALSGIVLRPEEDPDRAARQLLDFGAKAVLVKGGHRQDEPMDLLLGPDDLETGLVFIQPRIDTPHTHGTGCFLSSAIAAYLAQGHSLIDAVFKAKQVLTRALSSPIVIGSGAGYPDVFTAIQALSAPQQQPVGPKGRLHQARQELLRGLYVLTDTDLRSDRSADQIVRRALEGGARVFQLRDKRTPLSTLVHQAERLRLVVRKSGGLFLINDRVDIALASGADGVHLGPDDMHPADARRLLGPEKLIGVSVSSVEEAKPLAKVASYLGVGAIYGSATKHDAGPPVGVERIREIKRAFPHLPVVAIGGITADNIAEVAQAGADAAAVVSAVVAAPDMQQATADLVARFKGSR